jgi:serine/threonine protein kinase
MHAAGVAHCDLKRKDNTLIGTDETPYLIDFGVACILRDGDGWLKRRWFELMCQMDYNAWVKLAFGRNPSQLPTPVAARYNPLWIEKLARWIRVPWQKLTLRKLRKRWRSRS